MLITILLAVYFWQIPVPGTCSKYNIKRIPAPFLFLELQ